MRAVDRSERDVYADAAAQGRAVTFGHGETLREGFGRTLIDHDVVDPGRSGGVDGNDRR